MSVEPGINLDVTATERTGEHALRLSFSDGAVKDVDFGPFLAQSLNPATRKYLDRKAFGAFRLEWGNLVWGDFEMVFPVSDLYAGTI